MQGGDECQVGVEMAWFLFQGSLWEPLALVVGDERVLLVLPGHLEQWNPTRGMQDLHKLTGISEPCSANRSIQISVSTVERDALPDNCCRALKEGQPAVPCAL